MFASSLDVEASVAPDALAVSNADKTLRLTLVVEQGKLAYQVDRVVGDETAPVLELSPLGLTRADAEFATGLRFSAATDPVEVSDHYELVAGKRRVVNSTGRERTFTFEKSLGMTLAVAVRACADGVAFRYGLPGRGSLLHAAGIGAAKGPG